jgi:hypothetical protein
VVFNTTTILPVLEQMLERDNTLTLREMQQELKNTHSNILPKSSDGQPVPPSTSWISTTLERANVVIRDVKNIRQWTATK